MIADFGLGRNDRFEVEGRNEVVGRESGILFEV